MSDAPPEDVRMMRRRSVRLWTPDLETQLKALLPKLSSDGPTKGSQLLKLWEEAGHTGYTVKEMDQKMESMARIAAMLHSSGASGAKAIVDDIQPHSAAEDVKYFEEVIRSVRAEEVARIANLAESDKRTCLLTDALDRTALHIASDVGSLPIVRALVQNGASINVLDNEGNNPLFYALRGGRSDVVEYLLQRGADPKVQNRRGSGSLHLACHANDEASVRRLLAAGVSVNAQDDLKQTPLHVASHRSTVTVCDLLVQHGGSADMKDLRGNPPASLARRMSKSSNEKYLIQKMKTAITAVRAAVRLGLFRTGAMSPKKEKKTKEEVKTPN